MHHRAAHGMFHRNLLHPIKQKITGSSTEKTRVELNPDSTGQVCFRNEEEWELSCTLPYQLRLIGWATRGEQFLKQYRCGYDRSRILLRLLGRTFTFCQIFFIKNEEGKGDDICKRSF